MVVEEMMSSLKNQEEGFQNRGSSSVNNGKRITNT